jgi:exodeoxyribonuclease III
VERRRPAVPAGRSVVHREARILTLNIGAAAAERAERILRWLSRRGDDLIVLSETSAGPGSELLREGLERASYAVSFGPEAGERGVMIASRLPFAGDIEEISVSLPCRARGVVLNTTPKLTVVGVYVPSRDRSPEKVARKERFMASLLESVRALPPTLRESLILTGDYNAVARHHIPNLPGFFPYEYEFHEALSELGLSAAHELRPYGAHPHSWIGRTGIGYLYDYAHLGATLAPRLRRCQYLQGPRRQRLSDHAALALRLELG